MAIAGVPQGRYVLSAGTYGELPAVTGDEYCILGRSNVGKSSFLNHIFADKRLAHVSKTPGKTVCVNLFELDDGTFWTDLPGYGFAKMPLNQRDRMSKLINEYCTQRPNLAGVVLLLDIRHPGMAADKEVWEWLSALKKPLFRVLTKSDKLPRNAIRKHVAEYEKHFAAAFPPVTYSIAEDGSRQKFWTAFKAWVGSVKTGN